MVACSKYPPSGVARMSKLHDHIQCMRNTHLLGQLGHAPAIQIFSEIASEAFLATNTTLAVFLVCSLHVHMKVISDHTW